MNPEKPTIPEVLPLVRAYLAQHPAGGALHIVLGDGNVSDADVKFCIEHAKAHEDAEGLVLAELLLRMSRTQRLKLGAIR